MMTPTEILKEYNKGCSNTMDTGAEYCPDCTRVMLDILTPKVAALEQELAEARREVQYLKDTIDRRMKIDAQLRTDNFTRDALWDRS